MPILAMAGTTAESGRRAGHTCAPSLLAVEQRGGRLAPADTYAAACGGEFRDRLCGLGPALTGGLRGGDGGKLADPAHPLGGFLGVITEFLCHPASAALGTKP